MRLVSGLAALAMASPLPWGLGPLLHLDSAQFVLVAALAVLAIPLGRWAVGSWTAAAIIGACANLGWSYALVLDPQAAGLFLGMFLLAPYAAFTLAGCIGWFRDRDRKHRWLGVVTPPVLYVLPFIVLDAVNDYRFSR